MGLAAVGMAWAYRQGQQVALTRRVRESSPTRLRLPDGTWVDAENLADASQIMRTYRELEELPQVPERAEPDLSPDSDE